MSLDNITNMPSKRQIIELLNLTDLMISKCDPESIKFIPGRMLSIFHSLEDREINEDDFRELVGRIRKSSDHSLEIVDV